MTQLSKEEITENNKLIAEFMGLEPFLDSRYGTMYLNPVIKSGSSVFGHAGLKYHTSLDWLWPVKQKIVSLGIKFQCHDDEYLFYSSKYDGIWYKNTDEILGLRLAIVAFIQWQKSQTP
jgi:hypothetical protein